MQQSDDFGDGKQSKSHDDQRKAVTKVKRAESEPRVASDLGQPDCADHQSDKTTCDALQEIGAGQRSDHQERQKDQKELFAKSKCHDDWSGEDDGNTQDQRTEHAADK